ncbi:hypothetical protein SUNI508_13330 [Seiridium unicorne]|uniref:Protein SQS1 n=1 Tax=Seiridium unicorne TaxID=138068 RepID=A0ABR2VDD5_9PEZI
MGRRNTPKGKRQGGPSSGRPKGNPQSSRLNPFASPYNPSAPFAGPAAGSRGHTLADEARNTSKRPRSFFGHDAKLRHKPVIFVSAGLMDPMKELNIPQEEATQVVKKGAPKVEKHILPAAHTEAGGTGGQAATPADKVPVSAENKSNVSSPPQLFIVDTTGDKSLRPEKLDSLPILPRDDSEHDSDSSAEVILFKGRDHALRSAAESKRASPKPKQTDDSIQLHEMDVEIKVVEKTIEQTTAIDQSTLVHQSTQQETEQMSIMESLPAKNVTSKIADPSPFDTLLDATHSDEEAALVADYLANMDDDEDEDEDEDGEKEEVDSHPGLGSHAFHLLRDLGGSDSDAIPEPVTGDESDEDGDESDDDLAAEFAEPSDAQRQRVEQEDERMARLLAKQEELGLGGDDIVLYDDADDDDQGEWQIAPKTTPRRKKKGSTKQAKIVQKKGQFPSATAMANAFDELDLMDWHRAALNNFEQAAQRKSRPPVHSDSELEEAMNITFQKDRLKKAEKKRQREALRAQGLLGKNVNPDDLRVKYQVGMSKDELVFELEQFVTGDDEQLIFPPLDKHARKCLHTVASHLKIKSQSSGSGDNRHPVLFRTGRTLAYEEQMFERIVDKIIRRPYFTRVDVDTEVAKAHRAGLRKDTSNLKRKDNAVSYREGEVVGQHARELTSENKGRVLLEKMGWSKGMALGTLDNKGIMVPIAHVMKKSRLGLGDA